MPVYEARCRDCGATTDYVRSVDKRKEVPECPTCGGTMEQAILSAPESYVSGRFEPFKSSVDGSIIRNRYELEEHNRRNNVVSVADGYTDEQVKKGEMGKPAPKPDAKDIKKDIAESIQMVNSGYKPEIGAYDE